jgi:enterochelin esterase family protein
LTVHRVEPDAVEFAVPDPKRELERVSLAQELRRPRLGPPLVWSEGAWRVRFERPEVDRMEYLLEIDGSLQPDPANPRRAPGPFGDKSVIEWPEYEPPEWLDTIADAGPTEWLEIRCRRLVARVRVLLYSTPDPPPADAPLLVVHDGPEYAEYSSLTRFLDAMSWEERIPPLRAALVQPVDRNETYSASAQYAAALVRELLPEIERRAPHGPRIGMGASLGALAMLHAHKRHPRAFDGLFLQSGSFFRQRWDAQESGFERYRRITRFVGTVLRGGDDDRAIPVAITVGTGEENRENNRAVAGALEAQGYTAWLAEIRDAHNWTCWRDAFDPHLPALIEAVS